MHPPPRRLSTPSTAAADDCYNIGANRGLWRPVGISICRRGGEGKEEEDDDEGKEEEKKKSFKFKPLPPKGTYNSA